MHKPDIHNRRSYNIRRMIGSGGMILSLLIIFSTAVYVYNNRASFIGPGKLQNPFATSGSPSNLHGTSTCTTAQHDPGDSHASITSGGLNRTFIIHLPPSYGQQPQPVVLAYHGYSQLASRMEQYTNLDAEADKAGFIAIFPQGVDDPTSWNAGLGASGPTGDADDVQFTRDMLSYLAKNYCVNTHRIYVTGFSLGGGMAYRVACTLSGQIAAIATVAGAYYHAPGGCNPTRPLPVLEFHGQADKFAPYTGNPGAGTAAVQTYLNVWLTHNKCDDTNKVFFQQDDVTGIEWTNCTANTIVIHYRVSDGGHTWPGASANDYLGFTTHAIDANLVMWNFFSQYSV